jgi:hypothetical protein
LNDGDFFCPDGNKTSLDDHGQISMEQRPTDENAVLLQLEVNRVDMDSIVRHELLMRPSFGDVAIFEHKYPIGVHHRRQPVRDDNRGLSVPDLVECAARAAMTVCRVWLSPRRGA